MTFTLKPTRMTVSDLRPSLSYRVGMAVRSRAAQHWVELVIARAPELFAPDQASQRSAQNFVTFEGRFALPGGDAVIHVPPAALLALSGASRIYAGAAVFDRAEGGTPLAVIRPDVRAIYVDASGFTGAGLRMRFGFAARPGVTGTAAVAAAPQSRGWSGDLPEPGVSATPLSRNQGQPPGGAGASAEGLIPMQQPQGFMHRGGHMQPAPAQPAPMAPPPPGGAPQNGGHAPPPVDYDDGYGAPPPPIPPQNRAGNGNGQHAAPPQHAQAPQPMPHPNGNGEGNGYHSNGVAPPNGNGYHSAPAPAPAPMPSGNGAMPPPANGAHAAPLPPAQNGHQPQNGQNGAAAAQQGYYARPLEYVLPRFDDLSPVGIISTLVDAWDGYASFTGGVSDTTQFPFSAIVAILAERRRKSDGAVGQFGGTAFYIGPNTLLTCAHNFAEDDEYEAAHSATLFAALNNQSGSGSPFDGTNLGQETIGASAVTVHPTYLSGATWADRKTHDLAIVQVQTPAPNGTFFQIANYSPAADSKIAVCGYGLGSHAQSQDGWNWRKLLPAAQGDWRQHMDTDVIRQVVDGGEGIVYNSQTLAGNSGSPVFVRPDGNVQNPSEAMPIVGVHTRGHDNFLNYGVWMTPAKRDWALGFTTLAGQQSYHGHGTQRAPKGRAMAAPAVWSAVAHGASAIMSAGIFTLQASSGDISWTVSKMEGWKAPGEHPTPTIPVPENTLTTSPWMELRSPVYDGYVLNGTIGDIAAHFGCTFKYDGTGVGGIIVDAAPRAEDGTGGGLRVDMQIEPLSQTFPSLVQAGAQVACVELRIFYTFEWNMYDNDLVVVTHRFYGDGTHESNVRGGSATLDQVPATYTERPRS